MYIKKTTEATIATFKIGKSLDTGNEYKNAKKRLLKEPPLTLSNSSVSRCYTDNDYLLDKLKYRQKA